MTKLTLEEIEAVEWRPLVSLDSAYVIAADSRIRRADGRVLVRPYLPLRAQYEVVNLRWHGKTTSRRVANLLAEAWGALLGSHLLKRVIVAITSGCPMCAILPR